MQDIIGINKPLKSVHATATVERANLKASIRPFNLVLARLFISFVFITELLYSCAQLVVAIDEKTCLNGGF